MPAIAGVPEDGILALKLQWRRETLGSGSDPRFPVIQAGKACGMGWGGLWHLNWSHPSEERLLARALKDQAWNQVLVASTCPTAEVLNLEPDLGCGRWLGFFRAAGSRLNPAGAIDDKLSTAGYVITIGELPEPACEFHGEAVAGLMSKAGTWFSLRQGGHCVGWILAAFRCPGGVLLEALHVREPWRHRGLATRLAETAADGLTAWLLAGDTASTREFWAARGFGIAGEYTLYRRGRT